ncbi:NAD(P)H-dependent oxidoreductase [Kordiimonas sp.]|uniref:NAD(P)H-dependent oxidoreductase n=1 Tax=Kordiimonas sp. TaxID=1970157 RepID=UPI003A8D8DC2
MGKQIVILQGHPDTSEAHLCHALAEHYVLGAEAAGHTVTLLDIATFDFPLLRSQSEWETTDTPPGLSAAQAAILKADHLLIIYPLWLGGMPARLKGFFEQVLRPGLTGKGNNPLAWRKLKRGCSARIVITMGMPALAYRLFFRAHSLKALKRNILAFIGIGPIRTTIYGMVEAGSTARKARWLKKMEKFGHAAR